MNAHTRAHLSALRSGDAAARNAAYAALLEATEQPVDWAYDAWDELVQGLTDQDNHVRTIAAQVLCRLAKSDPQGRIFKDFAALLAVTRDPKFVTARHTLQALWQVGLVSPKHQKLVLDRLAARFADCAAEKNCTLIRYDIIDGLRRLYDHAPSEKLKAAALALIETEPDPKYRKKYSTRWRNT